MTETRSRGFSLHDIAVEAQQSAWLAGLMIVVSVVFFALLALAEWLIADGAGAFLQYEQFRYKRLAEAAVQRALLVFASAIASLKFVVSRAFLWIGHAAALGFALLLTVSFVVFCLPLALALHSLRPLFGRAISFFHRSILVRNARTLGEVGLNPTGLQASSVT